MNIRLIACIDKNNGLGIRNGLLYNLKDDLKRFKCLTENNVVVMGRKTLESLPNGLLPNRVNVVISRTINPRKGLIVYRSVEDFILGGRFHPEFKDKKIYVIGGGEIYSEFMRHASHLDITEVDGKRRADTYFPEIDENIWKKEMSTGYINEKGVAFRYISYNRIISL